MGVEYCVRESARAKRIIIRVVPGGLVEVVVPAGVGPGEIKTALKAKSAWIERAVLKMSRVGHREAQTPRTIEFRAVGRTFGVERVQGSELFYDEGKGVLRLGRAAAGGGAGLLRQWLKLQGKRFLLPGLALAAGRTGLEYEKAQVRLQKTRWGSCSAKKTISLNAKLLFLPPDMADYVMLHELCHTVHLNHSREFWDLCARIEPGFREIERRLRRAGEYVPAWVG